jgi:hypothetical protein
MSMAIVGAKICSRDLGNGDQRGGGSECRDLSMSRYRVPATALSRRRE